MGVKNEKFDADFKVFEKGKKLVRNKNVYYCMQKFSAYYFFGVHFLHFFNGLKFCVLYYPY
jgi:hypothetical protein